MVCKNSRPSNVKGLFLESASYTLSQPLADLKNVYPETCYVIHRSARVNHDYYRETVWYCVLVPGGDGLGRAAGLNVSVLNILQTVHPLSKTTEMALCSCTMSSPCNSLPYYCLEEKGAHYQNCSVLYCVPQLYTVISTHK